MASIIVSKILKLSIVLSVQLSIMIVN